MRKYERYQLEDTETASENQIFNISKDPAVRLWVCVIERAVLDYVNAHVRYSNGRITREEKIEYYRLSRDLFRKNGGLMPICEALSDHPEIMLERVQNHAREEATRAVETYQNKRRRLVIRY